MSYTKADHTFAICAYKTSPYLEECIQSIVKQEVLGSVIVTTYTPNSYIQDLCSKYSLPLYIGETNKDSAKDSFNFAASKIDTPLYTLCHQDDIYMEKYLINALKNLNKAKDPLLYFSDYYELRKEKVIKTNKILKFKRFLLYPFQFPFFQKSKLIRRRVLGLGNPFCNPTWCYVKSKMPNPLFENSNIIMSLDYEFIEILSHEIGSFVYGDSVDLLHRIHKETGTTAAINSGVRTSEELIILNRLWPKSIAKVISKFYSMAQNNN